MIGQTISHYKITAVAVALILLCTVSVSEAGGNWTSQTDDAGRYDLRNRRVIHGDVLTDEYSLGRSIVNDIRRDATMTSLLGLDTVPSPGLEFGITSYDLQHNASQGRQVARHPGSYTVHLAWTYSDLIPASYKSNDRFVRYSSWDQNFEFFNQGFDGEIISLGDFARAGFPRMDVDSDNLCHVALHQFAYPQINEYSVWHIFMPIEGEALHIPEWFGACDGLCNPHCFYPEPSLLWADIAIEQKESGSPDVQADIYHLISTVLSCEMPSCQKFPPLIIYWRFDTDTTGGVVPAWTCPIVIDSTDILGYVIDAADDLGKVAFVFHSVNVPGTNGLNNIVYRESTTGGLGWLNGSELGDQFRVVITNYADPDGPQAWEHISIAYDHAGALQIVWDEQRWANVSEQIAIKHWNDVRQSVRTVKLGYYDNDGNYGSNLNLNKITLGVGDGATFCNDFASDNYDFLYVLYTKNCGETPSEQADYSKLGYCNGELYLTASTDGGDTWSPSQNLTNTKTPNCDASDPDSVCASEQWATIGRDVSDIDIFYILDFEAGDFTRSGWVLNRAMYLRYSGGSDDAEYLCPPVGPVFASFITSDPLCEYNAPVNGTNSETLSVLNIGNANLIGDIAVSIGGAWLTVVGGGPYDISGGGIPDDFTVIMDATGLTEGLYVGELAITHNDTAQPNPFVVPIAFFVIDDFHCPEDVILQTGVSSPGVLSLQVSTDGRFGAPGATGGLWRALDSSSAIFDASLLVAHGTQGPDTVVFHRFYDRDDPGQYGFRSLGELEIDTSEYMTGAGFAGATTRMTTADSILGIKVRWSFMQHPDSSDFVYATYTISNRTDQLDIAHPNFSETVSDIVVALLADFNVLEAARQNFQLNVDNNGYYFSDSNFVYLYGRDTAGHFPNDHFQSSQRYSAGITYIAGRDANGSDFAFEPAPIRAAIRYGAEIQDDDGPTSGFLYETITGAAGVSIFSQVIDPDSSSDLYMYLTLDQGLTLAPGEEQQYIVALLSDTLQHFAYGPAPGEPLESGLYDALKKAWRYPEVGGPVCNCPTHGDPDSPGIVDVFDVLNAVGVAFQNADPVYDAGCPIPNVDIVGCDGIVDVFDVLSFVSVAFQNDSSTGWCVPCG